MLNLTQDAANSARLPIGQRAETRLDSLSFGLLAALAAAAFVSEVGYCGIFHHGAATGEGGDGVGAALSAFLATPIEARLRFAPSGAWTNAARSRNDIDRFIKRFCDLVLAALALIACAPFMAAVALAIKLDSRGPVFFVQTRRGHNNTLFRIIKFRSMTTIQSGRNVAQAKPRDCRVTRLGRWMRRYNIDELPQLINVLRGEMSLVGPRPHAVPHDRQFARQVRTYNRRNAVRPGMTGWAQVNGHRGPIETPEHIERRVAHDLHYIDNWSLPLDFWILAMTLFSRRAYRNAL